jgi:surface adhesion protein
VFSNSSDNPSTAPRTVTFTLADTSNYPQIGTAQATIDVTSQNDAPILAAGNLTNFGVDGVSPPLR